MTSTNPPLIGLPLPVDHPAKPVEEALRQLAPHLAAGLHAWITRPPRAPFAIRAILRIANRFTRTGRALRAFANAYVNEPHGFAGAAVDARASEGTSADGSTAEPPAAPFGSAIRANGAAHPSPCPARGAS